MSTTSPRWSGFFKRKVEPKGFCEFRRFHPQSEWKFGVEVGRKRRRVRCPHCNRKLTLRTIPDPYPHSGILGYEVPDHK